MTQLTDEDRALIARLVKPYTAMHAMVVNHPEEVAALLSAARTQSQGGGWEPIETLKREWLPLGDDSRDGTWNTEWVLCGRYQGKHFVSWVGMLDADTWLARDDRGHCVETDEPTHWRPLPAPPASQANG